jgi:hypothetical protein
MYLKINSKFRQADYSACYSLYSGFLLGLFFDIEDGSNMFLRNVGWLLTTRRRYIPEEITLHNHRCENLKSYINSVSYVHPFLVSEWEPAVSLPSRGGVTSSSQTPRVVKEEAPVQNM